MKTTQLKPGLFRCSGCGQVINMYTWPKYKEARIMGSVWVQRLASMALAQSRIHDRVCKAKRMKGTRLENNKANDELVGRFLTKAQETERKLLRRVS